MPKYHYSIKIGGDVLKKGFTTGAHHQSAAKKVKQRMEIWITDTDGYTSTHKISR